MEARLYLLFGGAVAALLIPRLWADSVIVISKRYSNNSYSCFVRHTKDGLEYRLTYNVCIQEPTAPSGPPGSNDHIGLQCLYYECTITATQLMSDDGQLGCIRYAYPPATSQPPMFDRITTYRGAISKHTTIPTKYRAHHTRAKRDFSWVTFLEKISFMGRHQSSVSKQNEAYFHYNYMNKPGSSAAPTTQTVPMTTGEPILIEP
uniref:Uncharacterized protein n=1 Tax=Anopheles culicifacies TaxID=139723 RepID=A0A182LYT3_9DIPT